MSAPTRVVVLGGGYVGVFVVRALRRAIRRGEVDVTVVNRDNFHSFHGFVHEMLTGKLQPGQIASPARRIFRPARFHNAEITAVDFDRRVVTTSRGLDEREYEIPYDHLVVGLGAVDDHTLYPGLEEHAITLRSYWNDFRLRNRLLSMLEMAEIEEDPEERRRLLTFVVVGANFGGIEIATHFRDFFDDLAGTDYPLIRAEEVRVVVVSRGERVLPELHGRQPKLVDYAERVLARSGIDMRLGRSVTAATPEEVVLDGGERIPTRTVVSCTGTRAPLVVEQMPFAKDLSGRLHVDRALRIPEAEGVWSGGDGALVPHPDGGTCPPLAIYAMRAGAHIGKNISRVVRGKEPKPFRFTGLGDACSLGGYRAVAHVKGVRFTGFPAWLIWKVFLLRYVPSMDRKLRMLFDWFMSWVGGRDIVNFQPEAAGGFEREVYEPGQDIVRQGQVGRRLFLIRKGEAQVFREEDGTEELLADLGPGDHFGEISVFEEKRRTATVRARTRVHVLSLGSEETLALADSVSSFGDAVRRLPGSS